MINRTVYLAMTDFIGRYQEQDVILDIALILTDS